MCSSQRLHATIPERLHLYIRRVADTGWGRLPSTIKPRPHQQQCRSNIVECYKSNDSFDKVKTNWTCSISFDFVERTKFCDKFVRHCCRFAWKQSRTLLWQSRTLFRHCCWCGRGLRTKFGEPGFYYSGTATSRTVCHLIYINTFKTAQEYTLRMRIS